MTAQTVTGRNDVTPSTEVISIKKAAAKIGVNASTLSRQAKAGRIRSHEGGVILAEVIEDRAKLNWTGQRGEAGNRDRAPTGGRSIERVGVDQIVIGDGRRPVDPFAVESLAESMATIGQKSPISYRRVPRETSDGVTVRLVLVAGGHRLAAAKQLGWTDLDAIEEDVDENQARLHEIAENLHRADLSALDRSEQISEWLRLTNKVAQSAPVSGGRGNEGGVRAASRELGVERTDAQRAVKVAGMSDEAKDAARAAGIDDNRSALLRVAQQATPEKQVAAVEAIAGRRSGLMEKLHAETKLRALKEAGAIIVDHLDPDYREALENNLRACGLTKLVAAITSTRRRQ